MKVEKLVQIIGADFYTGVPDSQLKPLCDYLMNTYGIDKHHHIIAANEGSCTALAAGYHLATGKVPVVYLQNSGEGNIINPAASLLNREVYAIPVVFIIGWRGEPGVPDEPQHIYQGKVTLKLMEDMGVSTCVVSAESTDDYVEKAMHDFREKLMNGFDVAFIIKKGALSYDAGAGYQNDRTVTREAVIRHIISKSGNDPVISTTGKASRELFEARDEAGQSHEYDFLTVGSMGHCSSIALGVALNKPSRKIWCIDGDGALLMHMGALAVIGALKPGNLIHLVINNCAHESVGGMPTVAGEIDIPAVARACGYPYAVSVDTLESLDSELQDARERMELSMIEVKCSVGSRNNLGRPATTPAQNKRSFVEYLNCGNGVK